MSKKREQVRIDCRIWDIRLACLPRMSADILAITIYTVPLRIPFLNLCLEFGTSLRNQRVLLFETLLLPIASHTQF